MSTPHRSSRALGRILAAATLAVAALGGPVTGALANVAPSGPMPIEHLCAGVPESFAPFADVDRSVFRTPTVCLAYARITQGSGASAYHPDERVTRQQMASFIARMMDTAADLDLVEGVVRLPDWDGRNRFTDVAGSSPHLPNVNRLAAAGIALGGPGGAPADHYGPGQPVSRAQMATFVVRSLSHLADGLEPAELDHFGDDGGNPHEGTINLVAEHGIAVGVGTDRFGPASSLTRGQMAAFLVRTLAALEFAAFIPALPATEG